jgi:hypothetical protein
MTRVKRSMRRGRWVGGLAFGIAVVAVWSSTAGADAAQGGTEMIRSWPTGLCVDSDGGGVAVGHECSFGTSQVWTEAPSLRLEGESLRPFNNEYRLVNQGTGGCLDGNADGAVYTMPCESRNSFQSWVHVTPLLQSPPADPSLWPVVYQSIATHRCLSIGTDNALRTVPCGADRGDAPWTEDMFFRRGF